MPNNNKQNGRFDEELVLSQLNTSCTVSYAKFIRFGYSKSVTLQELDQKCSSIVKKFAKASVSRSIFYSKLFLSIGFKLEEFTIGNEAIFFRSNKFESLEKFFSDLKTEPNLISDTKQTCDRRSISFHILNLNQSIYKTLMLANTFENITDLSIPWIRLKVFFGDQNGGI